MAWRSIIPITVPGTLWDTDSGHGSGGHHPSTVDDLHPALPIIRVIP